MIKSEQWSPTWEEVELNKSQGNFVGEMERFRILIRVLNIFLYIAWKLTKFYTYDLLASCISLFLPLKMKIEGGESNM